MSFVFKSAVLTWYLMKLFYFLKIHNCISFMMTDIDFYMLCDGCVLARHTMLGTRLCYGLCGHTVASMFAILFEL